MFDHSKLQDIKEQIVPKADAVLGRVEAIKITAKHAVNNEDMNRGLAQNEERIILGMGCFWGA
jgi:peptide-methionine (S)-S-oxide reductase